MEFPQCLQFANLRLVLTLPEPREEQKRCSSGCEPGMSMLSHLREALDRRVFMAQKRHH